MNPPTETALASERRNRWLGALLILASAFALYGNSLGNGYAIDDQRMTESNEVAARGFAGIPEILTTNFLYHGEEGATFRAIPRISFALEHAFFGPNPHVSHLLNLILYGVTGIVVMLLVQAIFPSAHRLLPLVVALLFMAHPIHSEVVANLKNRDELMACLFGFLSLLLLLRYYRGAGPSALVLGAASVLCSLLSKESGHQFLGVIPVALFFGGGWHARRMATAMAFALGATILFWTYVTVFLDQARVLYMAGSAGFNYLEHPLMFVEDFSVRYGTALYAMGYYLRLLLFPHPLSFFYGYGVIPLVGLGNGWALLSFVFYSALSLFALARLGTRSVPVFAIFFFLGTLAVFSNLLVPMQGIVAERHVFAASLGFCTLLGWILTSLPAWGGARMGGVAAAVGLSLILGLYGLKTVDRNRDWESRFTLVENDVQTFGDSAIIHAMLFKLHNERAQERENARDRREDLEQAVAHLAEVSRIAPLFQARVGFLVGTYQLHMLDAPREALASFQGALEAAQGAVPIPEPALKVEEWSLRLRLAEAHARLGEVEQATAELRWALEAYNAQSAETIPWDQLEGLSLEESIVFLTHRMAPR